MKSVEFIVRDTYKKFTTLSAREESPIDSQPSAYGMFPAIIWTARRWTSSTVLVCCLVRLYSARLDMHILELAA